MTRRSYPQTDFSTVGNVVISGVTTHARRQDRVSVVVAAAAGTRHRLVVSDEWAFRMDLRPGMTVSAAALHEAAETVRGTDVALAALARRAHSVAEIGRLLARRGIGRELAAGTLRDLRAAGLLDDASFATELVRARLASRGASVWALRRDLARRGVDRAVTDAAIAEAIADGGNDELDVARREGRRKWRSLSRLASETAVRRLVAFLRRRGYGADAVRTVAGELRDEGGA